LRNPSQIFPLQPRASPLKLPPKGDTSRLSRTLSSGEGQADAKQAIFTPLHPKLSCFVLARVLAAQNLPAPWLVKSSGGEGVIPAGADRLAGACILVLPCASGSTVIPQSATRSDPATCSLCYGGPPPLPFTPIVSSPPLEAEASERQPLLRPGLRPPLPGARCFPFSSP